MNLTCTAVIHPNISITPTFEWMGPMLSRESTNTSVKKLNNTTFQNILLIKRLTESYNGIYTCYVMVDNYTNKSDYQLHVISKHYSIKLILYYNFILTLLQLSIKTNLCHLFISSDSY